MKDQFRDGGIVVDNAIGFWIHRVYQATRNEMFRAFRERGYEVTPEQWAVLIRLRERDGCSQSELSDATFRDHPTMSRIVTGMEQHGWLERRTDPEDARARQVFLTRAARELKAKLVPVAEDIVSRLVAGIDERSLRTTRAALRKMFENIS
jgi:DNA-binding MarR family transcriptional regulator